MATHADERMSAVDSTWWRMEHAANQMVITGVLTFDRPLAYETVRALLERRLLVHPRFRQRIVEPRLRVGRPCWRYDAGFSIDRHLHRATLAGTDRDAELQALVGARMSTPLDLARPLWEMHLVERYGAGSALVVRIHHCIADGMALVRLLLTLDDTAGNEAALGRALGAGRATPAERTGTWRDALLRPRLADHLRMGARTVGVTARLLAMRFDPRTPLRGALAARKHAAWSEPLPLEAVKRAGRRHGTTVNDVLSAAVAGGLARYLGRRGGAARRDAVRAVVPVDLRRASDIGTLGNRFGLVFVRLPLGEAGGAGLLSRVKRTMDALKKSPEPMVLYGLMMLFGFAPRPLVGAITRFLGAKATLVMTDVPGPSGTISFCGARLHGLMAWVPQAGRLALGVSVLSYDGQVRVGVASDAALLADPDTLVDDVVAEIRALTAEPFGEPGATVPGGPAAANL
jgi:diacylglycerol O-acyltransferase / wax synthase